MAKSDYMPGDDGGKAELFIRFRDNITPNLATLGLLEGGNPVPEIVQQAADATYFRAAVDFLGTIQQSAQGWTAWKNFVRDGGPGAPPNPVVPPLPGSFPAAVLPGIVSRFRALVKSIKAHRNYTESIGQTLGIEGDDGSDLDFASLKPVLNVRLNGGQVEIPWNWNGFSGKLDAIEIHVDRGDGKGFSLLTIDTTAGYTDTAALPATPARWTYKAIYRGDDSRAGQWSDEATINVGG
ncbi:MAG TPA: hypothetical protein VIT91_14805 [Chthoniobacterales bacterium]